MVVLKILGGYLEVEGGGVAGGSPPGIWGGGNVPMPTPPIANVPGAPGYNPNPPGIWGGSGSLPPWVMPPIYYPPGGGGGSPPGIWGPTDPRPNPPIANVPGAPGYRPPGIWGGPIDPYPDHGLPQPPGGGSGPPTQPPPDASWQWGWSVGQGWHPVYVPGDKPQPVPPPTDIGSGE